MADESVNPYSAPLADPDNDERWNASPSRLATGLQKRSVIVMLILSIVTLGLYINYWVYRHAQEINNYLGTERISLSLVYAYWAVSLLAVGMIVPYAMVEEGSPIEAASDLLDLVDNIFTVFIAFVIRGGLDDVLGNARDDKNRFKGIWTFLFGIMYLQWKINRNLESGVFSD